MRPEPAESDEAPRSFLPDTPRAFLRGMGCLILLVLLATSAPKLFETRGRSSGMHPDAHAVGALRTITTAQQIFRESDRDQDGIFDYGDLTELGSANLVDRVLSAGVKQGYRFTVVKGSDGSTNSEYVWWAAAEPVKPGWTGDTYFFTNQGGLIYSSLTGPIRPKAGSMANEPASGTKIGGR